MEAKDKQGLLENLANISYGELGTSFGVNYSDIIHLIKVSIMYRSLYDVGFAARHRTHRTLKRTLNDLRKVVDDRFK